MLEKIKSYFEKYNKNANQKAKQSQMVAGFIVMVLMAIGLCLFVFIKDKHQVEQQVGIHDFDGVLDKKFNASTDEALIEKQNKKLTSLSQLTQFQQENLQKASQKNEEDKVAITSVIDELKEKIASLERDNRLAQNKIAGLIHQDTTRPPTREEQRIMQEQSRFYQQSPLVHMHLPKPPRKKKKKTNRNYIWAGTSVEGVLTTGILGDAGINGTKNKGSGVIRLIDNGLLPNKQHSFLKDCVVTYSSYGDLSSDTAVLHLDRLSCASSLMNFEKVVFGSVYDSDAMQDLRGTTILKTKPLLEYSAVAGILAGFGDGLKNLNTAQTVNPSTGTITTYGQASTILQSGAGGGLSNPANRIADYLMKIADIYHPVVVVKPERKVTVIFLKGFWTEDEEEEELAPKQNNHVAYRPVTSAAPHIQQQDRATLDSLLRNQQQMNQPLFKGA